MERRYFQVTGKPHSGIENPEKYGLTLEEVVLLIDDGAWKTFLKTWQRRKKRLEGIEELGWVCPVCSRPTPNLDDWMTNSLACRECDPRRKNDPPKATRLDVLKGGLARHQCFFCKSPKAKKDDYLNKNICETCKSRLEEYRSMIHEASNNGGSQ